MANIAYVQFSIKSSDPEKLLKALIDKGHVDGDIDGLLEYCEGEADFELEQAYTGYSSCGYISAGGIEGEIRLSGGMRWEGWFSSDDIAILKQICQENDIELKEVTSYWYDETLVNMGAQTWPVPDWIMNDEKTHAYKDGFAFAYPDEDYEDRVVIPDEETLEEEFGSADEFGETATRLMLEALKTGENPGFDEKWQKCFPHCILYDFAIDAEHRASEFSFEWDWTSEED